MPRRYKVLTDQQVQFFLDNGYVKIPNAFTKEKAEQFTKDMWIRLGMDPEDKSTWTREWTNLPFHNSELVSDFAPKAWDAICDLVGGEERIHPDKRSWSDGLIVNLGSEEFTTDNITTARDLKRWHCDGDFFLHFLDSPEQGLLVVPLFADVVEHQGGTMIAPQGIGHIARYMAAHPEGVMPTGFPFLDIALNQCDQYVELTGKQGDVVLLHPFMLHSAARNHLRIPRIISNPPVAMVEPFQYSRPSVDDYSLVELKTLRELGVDPLTNGGKGYDFKLVGERKAVVPARIAVQAKWKAEAMERLAKAKEAEKVQPKMSLDDVWDAIGY